MSLYNYSDNLCHYFLDEAKYEKEFIQFFKNRLFIKKEKNILIFLLYEFLSYINQIKY